MVLTGKFLCARDGLSDDHDRAAPSVFCRAPCGRALDMAMSASVRSGIFLTI